MHQPNESRRTFLRSAAHGLVAAQLSPLLFAEARAASPNLLRRGSKNTLVCIYLRGGADALNVVIPYTNQNYYTLRPTISIPPEKTEDDLGVIKLNDHFGLHPALAPLQPLWDQKRLVPILRVGSPHPTRSHFDAQDFMEYAAPGDRTVKEGWLNRYLRATAAKEDTPLRALAIQDLLPRALRGPAPVLAVPRLKSDESEGLLDLFDDVYKGNAGMEEDLGGRMMEGGARTGRESAVDVGRHTIETLRHFWEVVEKADKGKKNRVKYPGGGLATRLKTVASVIKADEGLEVVALDTSGYDTHQGQGSTDGSMQRLLSSLAQSVAAFYEDLGASSDRVTTLIMTEFGRTVAENGNRGTDHGRGGVMLALGGAINGGQVIGDFGTLDTKDLQDKRDLQVKIDFRSVFNEVLKGVHQFDAPKDFFPLFSKRDPLGVCR
jgi:uncharacterized protein (DUF1501 family)